MPETAIVTLPEFLRARFAEDEAAARAVPPLDYNVDMGGNRQDERFTFGRTLPSSADGMGNWSKHRDSTTTPAHFERWTPARVLTDIEAKRRIVELHPIEVTATLAYGTAEGETVHIEPDSFEDIVNRREMCTTCANFNEGGPCSTLKALALPFADHPEFREEWRG